MSVRIEVTEVPPRGRAADYSGSFVVAGPIHRWIVPFLPARAARS